LRKAVALKTEALLRPHAVPAFRSRPQRKIPPQGIETDFSFIELIDHREGQEKEEVTGRRRNIGGQTDYRNMKKMG
jgi:hypothetical protein